MTEHEVDQLQPGDRLNLEAAGRLMAGIVEMIAADYVRVKWRGIWRGDVILKHSPLWLAVRVYKEVRQDL